MLCKRFLRIIYVSKSRLQDGLGVFFTWFKTVMLFRVFFILASKTPELNHWASCFKRYVIFLYTLDSRYGYHKI